MLIADNDTENDPPAKRRKIQSTLHVTQTKRKWDDDEQERFKKDLCRLFVANNIPWNVVNNPEFKKFASAYLGNPPLPSRQTLSGRILRNLVKEVEGDVRKRVSGQMGTGQCDGWKNIARISVVATIVTVNAEVRV